MSTEPDAPPMEFNGHQYRLSCDNRHPCQYYLSVDGGEELPIEVKELNVQSRFRDWHLDHEYEPPQTEKNTHKFEEMVVRLFAARTRHEDPLPFRQTDAGHIENLAQFFDPRIRPWLRQRGEEFLKGKVGDNVRLKLDDGRIYFKWQVLKQFYVRILNARQKDIEAIEMFITKKGGYQGEQGTRGWYRNTYWVQFDLFNKEWQERWLREEIEEEEENA